MYKLLILIVAVASISEARHLEPRCEANEVYRECGTLCEPICGKAQPLICPQMCISGCFCKEGYVKNDAGECIEQSFCDELLKKEESICPMNAEYQSCGTACEPECGERTPLVCTEQCIQGCFCKPGYVKTKSGECIEEYFCDMMYKKEREICPLNAEYVECGSACETKCGEEAPMFCTLQCIEGCFCKEGYVKNEAGECIEQSFCDELLKKEEPTCPMNAEYLTCGSACERKCGEVFPLFCTEQCVEGCFCKPGYVKTETGECIEESFCDMMYKSKPEICPLNAEYVECGSACEPKCGEEAPMFCTLQCVEGCVCKEGYIKNEAGECIEQSFCDALLKVNDEMTVFQEYSCGANEEYLSCGVDKGCEPTCSNPFGPWACTDKCVSGCFCKNGFYRNGMGGCVEYFSCL